MTKDAQRQAARILVVDDEPDLRTLYELTLLREGHQVDSAGTLAEARDSLHHGVFDLLITDMRLPDGLGLQLIRDIASQGRSERSIVVTAYGSADSAVEALKQGAFDYLTKPVDLKQLRTAVATALQRPGQTERLDLPRLRPETRTSHAPGVPPAPGVPAALRHLVGTSQAMTLVRERIARVASSMAPVMVLGESGTGKELVARAIHDTSHRADGPFVAVNCGAIPDTLIEAEFFGARKGAYTGATTDREGYFAAARGGTLFLDEIGDLPTAMQAKLLRVIQERRVRPLGGVQEEQVDVRILCATHKDLSQAVAEHRFRQDLYYRLNVIEIRLPALRERRDDLDDLVSTLMHRICRESGQQPVTLDPAARQWLQQHAFPGNVRELENLLHRALALCTGELVTLSDLLDPQATWPSVAAVPSPTACDGPATPISPGTDTTSPAEPVPAKACIPCDIQQYLDEQERAILVQALQETRGNRTAAAARLGLNLRQIRYRIARLGIQVGEPDTAPADPAPQTTGPDRPHPPLPAA